MDTILLILTVAGIHLLLVVTPGANFLVVSQHALRYSRHVGLVTAAGVGTATIIQIMLGFLGLAAIMAQSLSFFNTLKLLGALYLIYLGGRVFWKERKPLQMASQHVNNLLARDDAYRIGLLTCLSNPKSIIYYLALFTTIIPPTTPIMSKVMMGVVMVLISCSWYALVAICLSYARFQRLYARFEEGIDYLFGSLMIGFGLKIWISQ